MYLDLSPTLTCILSLRRGFHLAQSQQFIHPSDHSSDWMVPSRGNRFPLSPGERAGVRAGVTQT